MITRQSIINRVRFLIAERDPDNSFVYDPDIIEITNNILPTFSREIKLPRANINITTIKSTIEYEMEARVLDVLSVTYKQKLDYKDYNTYLLNKDEDGTFLQTPSEYYLREGLNEIEEDTVMIVGLDPAPDGVYTLVANCVILPNDFSGEAVQSIPYPTVTLLALCYKICQDLMIGDNKPEMSELYRSLYEDEKTRIKNFLNGRTISYVTEGRHA